MSLIPLGQVPRCVYRFWRVEVGRSSDYRSSFCSFVAGKKNVDRTEPSFSSTATLLQTIEKRASHRFSLREPSGKGKLIRVTLWVLVAFPPCLMHGAFYVRLLVFISICIMYRVLVYDCFCRFAVSFYLLFRSLSFVFYFPMYLGCGCVCCACRIRQGGRAWHYIIYCAYCITMYDLRLTRVTKPSLYFSTTKSWHGWMLGVLDVDE